MAQTTKNTQSVSERGSKVVRATAASTTTKERFIYYWVGLSQETNKQIVHAYRMRQMHINFCADFIITNRNQRSNNIFSCSVVPMLYNADTEMKWNKNSFSARFCWRKWPDKGGWIKNRCYWKMYMLSVDNVCVYNNSVAIWWGSTLTRSLCKFHWLINWKTNAHRFLRH